MVLRALELMPPPPELPPLFEWLPPPELPPEWLPPPELPPLLFLISSSALDWFFLASSSAFLCAASDRKSVV